MTKIRASVLASLMLIVTFFALLGSAQTAEAASASCGSGRCVIYLSNAETRALGSGRVPAPPAWVPWPIKAAYYPTAVAHRWFASQYANRGQCSAFVLDVRPWSSQGYMASRC